MASKPRKDAAPQAVAKTFEQERAQHFPADVVAGAQKAAHDRGLPAAVVLAQAALETGYFQHFPPDSNNYLGIKWSGNGPFVDCPTREVFNGDWVTVHQKFQVFATPEECFDRWAALITSSRVYLAAFTTWNRSKDPFKLSDAIACHWATDPGYSVKLREIMSSWKLSDFDRSASPN